MADEDFMKKRLASFLNRDKVKLWEEPFTNKDGSAGNIPQTSKQPLSLEIKLLEQGKQLRDQVSDLIHHPGDQMKLICSGLVLKDDLTLQQQNVRVKYDEMDIQIADQTGKPIQLPAGEKKALTLAIALHEKGRQAQCRADILNSVDNYAILCLDIGSTGEELALFMKLHLLQGIVAYHQDRMSEAAQLLGRAESELQRLTIDEDKLNAVMTMGFSEGEARLGLRAVKVESYEMLIGMGYPKGAAAEALRQANNDLNLSLEVLQNHPEYLSLPDPVPKRKVRITDEMIAQVTSMGFEPEMAKWALQKNEGNVGKAIEDLIESGGSIQSPLDDEQPGTSGSSDNCPTVCLPLTVNEKSVEITLVRVFNLAHIGDSPPEACDPDDTNRRHE
ncbi:NUB1-like protein [Mya arenaria]|uniref:NUB1-like protein n=1 Tax=Mya arenaria TaxID=6604 RepID=A0ABY7EKZ1_MYAAR|nr:NUB1-like protein [Mya arenaria]